MSKSIPVEFVVDRETVEKTFNKFLVVGPGYWGRGLTLKEARKNCLKEGCKVKDKMTGFWGTDDLTITSGGYVQASNMVSLGEI